jgi:hypothetical protein
VLVDRDDPRGSNNLLSNFLKKSSRVRTAMRCAKEDDSGSSLVDGAEVRLAELTSPSAAQHLLHDDASQAMRNEYHRPSGLRAALRLKCYQEVPRNVVHGVSIQRLPAPETEVGVVPESKDPRSRE